MFPRMTTGRARAAIIALLAIAVVAYGAWRFAHDPRPETGAATRGGGEINAPSNAPAQEKDSVELSDTQLAFVKVEPVEDQEFPVEREAIGSIDFDQDMSVQVFTPYQGRIISLYGSIGDDVTKGQTLFTIDSPDLLQAESTLIAAAGVLELTTRSLARLRELYKISARLAARRRPGDLRPPDRRRQPARGARCGADCSARPTPKSTRSLPTAAPTRRLSCRARSRAGSLPATRLRGCSCSRATRRRRTSSPTSPDVDAGERDRGRQPRLPPRPGGAGHAECVPGPGIRRQDHDDRRERRPEYASRAGPLRDQGSAARIARRHVREFRHPRLRRRRARRAYPRTAWCAKAMAR